MSAGTAWRSIVHIEDIPRAFAGCPVALISARVDQIHAGIVWTIARSSELPAYVGPSQGVHQLHRSFRTNAPMLEEFEGWHFMRLVHLKLFLNAGRLDDSLQRRADGVVE